MAEVTTGKTTSISWRTEIYWVLPTVLAVAGIFVFLLINRRWGADASALLAIPLEAAGLIVSILVARGAFTPRPSSVTSERRRLVVRLVAGFTALAVVGTTVAWWIKREGDPFDYMSGDVRIGYVAYEYLGWHTDDSVTGAPKGFDVDVVREIEAHFPDAHVVWVDLGNLENRVNALGRRRVGDDRPRSGQRPSARRSEYSRTAAL